MSKNTILKVYEDFKNENFPEVDEEILTSLRRDYQTEKLVMKNFVMGN